MRARVKTRARPAAAASWMALVDFMVRLFLSAGASVLLRFDLNAVKEEAIEEERRRKGREREGEEAKERAEGPLFRERFVEVG